MIWNNHSFPRISIEIDPVTAGLMVKNKAIPKKYFD